MIVELFKETARVLASITKTIELRLHVAAIQNANTSEGMSEAARYTREMEMVGVVVVRALAPSPS